MTAAPLTLAGKLSLSFEVVAAYMVVRWSLRRNAFPAALERIRSTRTVAAGPAESDERLVRAARRTLRLLPADTRCLMESLVVTRLLARRGRDTRLVIGVSPSGTFGAHAWVERDGRPLLPVHRFADGRLAEL